MPLPILAQGTSKFFWYELQCRRGRIGGIALQRGLHPGRFAFPLRWIGSSDRGCHRLLVHCPKSFWCSATTATTLGATGGSGFEVYPEKKVGVTGLQQPGNLQPSTSRKQQGKSTQAAEGIHSWPKRIGACEAELFRVGLARRTCPTTWTRPKQSWRPSRTLMAV